MLLEHSNPKTFLLFDTVLKQTWVFYWVTDVEVNSISRGGIDTTFSPDVGNPCNPHLQWNQTKDVQKYSYVK